MSLPAVSSTGQVAVRRLYRLFDWCARIVVVYLIICGATQILQLVTVADFDHDVSRAAPANENDTSIALIGAVESWSVPGRWSYAKSAGDAKSETDSFTKQHLVTMPEDGQVVARRTGTDGQILVEIFSTRQSWNELNAMWKGNRWSIQPIPGNEGPNEVAGCYLTRDRESVLVWVVAAASDTTPATISCSRSHPSVDSRNENP